MLARLAGTAGVRSVIAESALLKHQLLIVNRPRRRAPNLRVTDRFIVAVCSLFIRPAHLVRSAIILRPSTILNFHRNLVKLKYRLLSCPKRRAKPGLRFKTISIRIGVTLRSKARHRSKHLIKRCQLQILSLTETLPWSISDANPSVTNNSPPTPSMTCCCLWFGHPATEFSVSPWHRFIGD